MYKAHQKEGSYIIKRNIMTNNVRDTSKGRGLHNMTINVQDTSN